MPSATMPHTRVEDSSQIDQVSGTAPRTSSKPAKWRSKHVDLEGENWYRVKLRAKKCTRFVLSEAVGREGRYNCQCGLKLSEHQSHIVSNANLEPSDDPWDADIDTILDKTNAYGEVSLSKIEGFVGHAQKTAKYVRFSDKTNYDTVYELLVDKWRINRPNLVLHVLGGQACEDKELNSLFIGGILNASTLHHTRGWVFGNGVYTGVMDHAWLTVDRVRPTFIAITPWGNVFAKEKLISESGRWPARYRVELDPPEGQVVLDLNMSHFLLIDDGTNYSTARRVYDFYTGFLDYLKQRLNRDLLESNDQEVPFVNVLFNGGVGDLKKILQNAESDAELKTPTVIVAGSGGAASVLAAALHGSDESTLKRIAQEELPDDVADNVVKIVKDCSEHKNLLCVFDNEDNLDMTIQQAKRFSLDTVILQSPILKGDRTIYQKLSLCLNWDRTDLARAVLKDFDRTLEEVEFRELAFLALKRDRSDFIDLLLVQDYDLGHIVTKNTLEDLYNQSPDHLLLRKLLEKTRYNKSLDFIVEILRKMSLFKDDEERKFTLKDIGRVIRRRIGYFYDPIYLRTAYKKVCLCIKLSENDPKNLALRKGLFKRQLSEENDFEEPARELFVWALLNEKDDVAHLLWTKQKSPMAAALTATNLLKALSRGCMDENARHRYAEQADFYQAIALGVLSECDKADDQAIGWNENSQTSLTEYLLIRKQELFGKATCLELAFEGRCQDFIAHRSVQTLLDKVWRGKISLENESWRIVICLFFPILIFAFIYFREDETDYKKLGIKKSRNRLSQKEVKHGDRGNLDMLDLGRGLKFYERLYYFFTAPVIVFSYSCMAYLVLLLLFSYVVLTDFRITGPGIPELVLAAWVGTLYLEEIRQAYKQGMTYFKHWSNYFDLLALVLFVVGFVLRFNTETFETARYFMCMDIVVFYLRLLHIFSVFQELGPMLIMIKKMTKDLVYFLFFIAVFFIAYGIVWTALLYPNTPMSLLLVYSVLRASYWPMHGEVQTYLQGDLEVGNCLMVNGTLSGCSTAQLVTPPLLAIYILFINVLMFNLLIALFSHRFEEMHEGNDIIWSFQRYSLIREYIDRPPMPPPLIILCHVPQWIHYLIKKLIRLCCCCVIGGKRMTPRFLKPVLEYRWPWDRQVKATFTRSEKYKEYDLSGFECLNAETFNRRRLIEPPITKEKGLKGLVESLSMELRGENGYVGLREKIDSLEAKFDALAKQLSDSGDKPLSKNSK